jgi:hypothetical protein
MSTTTLRRHERLETLSPRTEVRQLEGSVAKYGCRARLGLLVPTAMCLRTRPSGHGGLNDGQNVSRASPRCFLRPLMTATKRGLSLH